MKKRVRKGEKQGCNNKKTKKGTEREREREESRAKQAKGRRKRKERGAGKQPLMNVTLAHFDLVLFRSYFLKRHLHYNPSLMTHTSKAPCHPPYCQNCETNQNTLFFLFPLNSTEIK